MRKGWRYTKYLAGVGATKAVSGSAFRAQSVVKESCYSVCACGTYYVLV